MSLKQKLPTSKPKPCGQLRKVVTSIKNIVVLSHTFVKIDNTITNLFTKNLALSKVDTAINTVISATKISNKIYEPTKYNEAIANPIYDY